MAVGQLCSDIAPLSNPRFACLPGLHRELVPFVPLLCKNVPQLLKRVRPQSIGFSRRQKGEQKEKQNISSLRFFRGSSGLCLSVVRPSEQKVARISEESVFALARSDVDKHGGGVTRQILSDSASSHSSHMESFCMATPGLWGLIEGVTGVAGGALASLGAGGGAAGWIFFTRAPLPTVSPLAALLKPTLL